MAFIIDKYGNKIKVDIENDYISEKCVLYDDTAVLREVYLLNLYGGKHGQGYASENPPDLIAQIEYKDKPPTQEQIMFQMSKHNLSRHDIATIEKGYMLDFESYKNFIKE